MIQHFPININIPTLISLPKRSEDVLPRIKELFISPDFINMRFSFICRSVNNHDLKIIK